VASREQLHAVLDLLREDPALLEEVRAVLLTEELLRLPLRFERFLVEEFRPLAARVNRAEADVATLKSDVASLKSDVATLKSDVATLKSDVAVLKGDVLEQRVRSHLGAFLPDLDRLRVLDDAGLEDVLGELDRRRRLSREDRVRLRQTDVVALARRGSERVTVLAEVSATVGRDDVDRARTSARVFEERGLRCLPVAIGQTVAQGVAEAAAEAGVEVVAREREGPPADRS
jgi:cell division protein FtsB